MSEPSQLCHAGVRHGRRGRPGADEPTATRRRALPGAVLLVGLGLAQVHCDNGATGVDACRSIEDLRCQLVIGCPGSPVTTEDDVKNCQVFYRDECMHGMPDGLDPDQGTVDQCVNALQAARSCWDSGQTLGPCAIAAVVAGTTPAEVVSGQSPDTTGCQAIQAPQILQACSFLQPSTATATGGSGGTTPTGGTGGAGG